MSKRPSLAETMRQVAVTPEPTPPPAPAKSAAVQVPVEVDQPTKPETRAAEARPYFAATRVGKKKVTAALSPAAHKQLKSLAIEHDTKSEALITEAIRDLFAKYGKPAID